jgi:MSHA biogenesis protein MshQ
VLTVSAKHIVNRPATAEIASTLTIVANPLDLDGVPGTGSMTTATEFYYGRIKLPNVYGSELLPLKMTAVVQYCRALNGTVCSDWVTSTSDTTSVFALAASNPTQVGLVVTPAVLGAISDGQLIFSLSGTGRGSVDVSSNTLSYLISNTARATFGVYKGNPLFIYRGRRGR